MVSPIRALMAPALANAARLPATPWNPGIALMVSDRLLMPLLAESIAALVLSVALMTMVVAVLLAIDHFHYGLFHDADPGECRSPLALSDAGVAHDDRQGLVTQPSAPGHAAQHPLRAHLQEDLDRGQVLGPNLQHLWRWRGIHRDAECGQGCCIDRAANVARNQAACSLDQFFCRLSVSSRM